MNKMHPTDVMIGIIQPGYTYPGGGFKYFLCSPLFGEDSYFD